MKVSPIDIQQKRFHLGLRGYERAEVDAFLELVKEELEGLAREVSELREFRQSYEDRVHALRDQEDTVKNTLLMTQRVVEDMKENSRKEAALVVRDAEVRGQQLLGSAQLEKGRLEAEIMELKRRRHHFLQDMKKAAQMHLEMVNFEETGGEGGSGPGAE